MSEAAAPTVSESSATTPELSGSVEDRANALFGPGPSESAGEAGSPPTLANDTASPADSAAPPEDDANAKARAERRAQRQAQLAELNAKTRAKVDSAAAQREAETLRERIAEYERRQAQLVDPTQLDPLGIIQLGQRAGHDPKAIAAAIQQAMGSPELAAAHAAKQAVDPVVAKLQNDLSAALRRIDEFETRQTTAAQQAAEQQAAAQFQTFAAQNAATSPLAARFLAQHGPEEFHALTLGAASALTPNAGPQALLDEIEDRLTELGRLYANPAPAGQQRTPANSPRIGTAAQAPTHVTNTLAQQRTSVVDEAAALENMSLEERAALLFGS